MLEANEMKVPRKIVGKRTIQEWVEGRIREWDEHVKRMNYALETRAET